MTNQPTRRLPKRRDARLLRVRSPLAGLLSGVMLALSLRVPGLGLLVAVALVPLLAVCLDGQRARAAVAGWLGGLVFFGTGFAWVLSVRGSVPVPPVVFAAGVAVLALFVSGFALGVAQVGRRAGAAAALVAAPGVWVVLEWLRSQGPIGTPWLRLGGALADQPLLIQGADLGGVFLLSAWVVALNGGVAAVLLLRRPGAAPLLAALVAVPLVYGGWSLARHAPGVGGTPLRVAAVQPNVAEERRHDPARFDVHLRKLLALSQRVASQDPDLVVWPETAYERPIAEGDPFLGAIANQLDRPLLTGVRRFPADGSRTVRNSVALALPGGETRAVADKVHPVPVYESAPPAAAARMLATAGWWPGRVEPAEAPGLVSIPGADGLPLRLGVLICFDASHTDVARSLRNQGARLLVGVYNEAQAGRWVAHQHELFARLRAVENRVPVVRVANTGRSAWIDGAGRTVKALGADVEGAASAALSPAGPLSLYSRWGDEPVVTLALFVPAVAGVCSRRRSRRRFRQSGFAESIEQPSMKGLET